MSSDSPQPAMLWMQIKRRKKKKGDTHTKKKATKNVSKSNEINKAAEILSQIKKRRGEGNGRGNGNSRRRCSLSG